MRWMPVCSRARRQRTTLTDTCVDAHRLPLKSELVTAEKHLRDECGAVTCGVALCDVTLWMGSIAQFPSRLSTVASSTTDGPRRQGGTPLTEHDAPLCPREHHLWWLSVSDCCESIGIISTPPSRSCGSCSNVTKRHNQTCSTNT